MRQFSFCFILSESYSLGRTRASSSRINYNDDPSNFQIERNIANEIMETVQRLQLPFRLDQLTEGRGNCFPISIMQQCRRPEIFSQLKSIPKMLVKHKSGHSGLRYNIKQFIMKSKHQRVARFRAQYEETDGMVNQETWLQYWTRMAVNGTWVDVWFVQATAWYLQLDIWIIATSNTEESPYIEINGNIDDDTRPCNGPVITIGTKSNCHYQSLLPTEFFHLDFHQPEHIQSETLQELKKPVIPVNAEASTTSPQTTIHSNEEMAEQPLEPKDDPPLIYESSGKILTFLRMSDDYVMKCPLCKTETKYIVRHFLQEPNQQRGI
jgi:hypothetical protein